MSDNNPLPTSADSQVVARSSLQLTLRRLYSDYATMAAVAVIILIIVLAIIAPWIATVAGHSPIEQFRSIGLSASGIPVGPGHDFWLGSDQLGRDVLVRLAYGARVSLLVGVVASVAASAIAVTVGVLAGYFGGKIDAAIGLLIDLIMSVPFMLCALALVSVLGPSLLLSISESWLGKSGQLG